MTKKARVLVVDDSALMREIICDVLRESTDFEVAGTAFDGRNAVRVFQDLKPDLVTLDVEMPQMDGLATLEQLLAISPVPVMMVSALTQLGAETTFTSLERGALDYIGKPQGNAQLQTQWREDLLRKLRQMAGCDVTRVLKIRQQRAQKRADKQKQSATVANATTRESLIPARSALSECCVALGISTGGPPALTSLFETLTGPLPPIVIVQHMPADFTKPFAWRLNSLSTLNVKEAATGDRLKPNSVYVAPGGKHLTLVRAGAEICCRVKDGEPVSSHKPSVDVMMKSAAELFGPKCLGVIMTGMGRDGSEGCREIRAAGGYVIGQDEASSDVYGMNKVAFVSGHVHRQFSLDSAASLITQQARKLAASAATVPA